VLNDGIDFDAKADFIAACRKLNERRNKIAHRMGTGITASVIEKRWVGLSKPNPRLEQAGFVRCSIPRLDLMVHRGRTYHQQESAGGSH
jgi:hypothetical protein